MDPTPNPYSAPVALPALEVAAPAQRRKGRALVRSAICLGAAIGVSFIGGVLAERSAIFPIVAFFAFVALAVTGAAQAWLGVARAAKGGAHVGAVVAGVALFLMNAGMLLFGALVSLFLLGGGRGRQVRRFGHVLLPRLRGGDAWSRGSAPADSIEVDASVRDRVAAEWRENAKTEHASVAAFARLTLDLVALGAPPELLTEAQNDALDEIAHARLCLSLASAIDGEHQGPAPFPQVRHAPSLAVGRTMALASLAVGSLVDGVLREGVSARVIARLARIAEEPAIQRVLSRLAADEGRHAAHAWHVVDWCAKEGGGAVVSALQGAARAIPARRGARPARGAEDGAWERWGIPGDALDAAEYDSARRHLVQRVAALASARRAAGEELAA